MNTSNPGWQTSEFWLTAAAMIVGAVLAAGVFPAASPVAQALGVAASILASLGYTYSRTTLKKTAVNAEVAVQQAAPSSVTISPGPSVTMSTTSPPPLSSNR